MFLISPIIYSEQVSTRSINVLGRFTDVFCLNPLTGYCSAAFCSNFFDHPSSRLQLATMMICFLKIVYRLCLGCDISRFFTRVSQFRRLKLQFNLAFHYCWDWISLDSYDAT